jgi:hypothetical protein
MRPVRLGSLRVGDQEREATVAALGRHFAEGRLTSLEHEERTALALTARTVDDLDRLLADLPLSTPAPKGGTRNKGEVLPWLLRGTGVAVVVIVAAALVVGLLELLPLIAALLLGFVIVRAAFGRHRHPHHHHHHHHHHAHYQRRQWPTPLLDDEWGS